MIEKIQSLIEDNTEIDVTRNQVKLALMVLASLLVLVILFFYQSSTGPQEDAKSVIPVQVDYATGDFKQR